MGIFDKDFLNKVNKALDSVTAAAADGLDGAADFVKDTANSGAFSDAVDTFKRDVDQYHDEHQTSATATQAQYQSDAVSSYNKVNLRDTMPKILAEYFSDYTISNNVPAAQLNWDVSPCKPYDFLLAKDGYVRALIMVTDHNRDGNRAFLNAKQAALQGGVPFINFYSHFPNETSYVVGRIKSFLG